MVRVAILGATGYTALELIKLLLRHPEAKITALTTRQSDAKHVGEVHPSLAGRLDLRLENLSPAQIGERADAVFCCLPHGASAAAVVELLPAGKKIVDLSADYRLNDAAEAACGKQRKAHSQRSATASGPRSSKGKFNLPVSEG